MREHLEKNSLLSKYQSAYRKFFSTKTALAKVTNDLLLNLDRTKSTFYFGLDLSAAFDTLDHELLPSILETSLGFKEKVLSFLNSYLSSRSQKELIDGEYSMPRTIKTGVPQGSILGPVLFSCYLVPLEVLFERLDVNYHFYANDTVIYFLYHASINQRAFDLILTTLQKWFSGAKLRLNSNKTEYMFVSRKNSLNCDIELATDANFSNNVTLLGLNLDSRHSYEKQVSSVCRRCYYFLRKNYSIRDTVDRKSLIELVRVMIVSRLNYCNSLYYGLPVNIIQKLQRIINSFLGYHLVHQQQIISKSFIGYP